MLEETGEKIFRLPLDTRKHSGNMSTPESGFISMSLIWTEVPFIQEVSDEYSSPFQLDTYELKVSLAWTSSGAFEKRSPSVCFSKAPETFRVRKACFIYSVFKDRGVFAWNLYEENLYSFWEYVHKSAL